MEKEEDPEIMDDRLTFINGVPGFIVLDVFVNGVEPAKRVAINIDHIVYIEDLPHPEIHISGDTNVYYANEEFNMLMASIDISRTDAYKPEY